MSHADKRDQFDLKHGQKIEILTLEGGCFLSGTYENQNRNRIEIIDVTDLITKQTFLFKFISKMDIAEIRQIQEENEEEIASKLSEKYLRPEKHQQIRKIIEEFNMIKNYDMFFKDAIAEISNLTVIGVAVATSKSSGCHIAISTDKTVFIFDMTRLLKRFGEVVIKDLDGILSSKDITKIVHDVRSVCRPMESLYKIKVASAVDVMAFAAAQGYQNEIVTSFDSLLNAVLNVDSQNELFHISGSDEFSIKLALSAALLLPMQQKLSNDVFSQLTKNIDTSANEFLDAYRNEKYFENVEKNMIEVKNMLKEVSPDIYE